MCNLYDTATAADDDDRCGSRGIAPNVAAAVAAAVGQGWTTEHDGSCYKGHGFKFWLSCDAGWFGVTRLFPESQALPFRRPLTSLCRWLSHTHNPRLYTYVYLYIYIIYVGVGWTNAHARIPVNLYFFFLLVYYLFLLFSSPLYIYIYMAHAWCIHFTAFSFNTYCNACKLL